MKHKVKEGGENEQGFTLIEVAMGIAIFAIAVVGIMMTLGHSLTMSTFANNRALAMNKAQGVLEEIRRVADQNGPAAVAAGDWTNWVAANVTNNPSDILDNELVMVTDLGGGNPRGIQVTITWNEKGKQTTYAVSTMVTQR